MLSKTNKTIAVHLHIYYEEMWGELAGCLGALQGHDYDLFVTLVKPNAELEGKIKAFKPTVEIFVVENRGYDVGAFIYVLNHINLNNYDYVIKLHTKRNLQQKVSDIGNGFGCLGGMWREWLLSFMQPRHLEKCLSALAKNPHLGACCYYKCIHPIENFRGISAEARERYKDYMFGLPSYSFVAGTMFIMRADLLTDVQKMSIKQELFDEPDARHSMQFAHIMERTLGEVVYAHHCHIKDVFTPFAGIRRAFWLSLRYLKRFLFQKKITKSNKLVIKICKLPIYSGSITR